MKVRFSPLTYRSLANVAFLLMVGWGCNCVIESKIKQICNEIYWQSPACEKTKNELLGVKDGN